MDGCPHEPEKLVLRPLDECGSVWRVEEDVWLYGRLIPAGFVTNGFSVPRLFRWVVSPMGRCRGAAIVHDYDYYLVASYKMAWEQRYGRKLADRKLRRNLLRCGRAAPVAWFAWAGVRLIGWTKIKQD